MIKSGEWIMLHQEHVTASSFGSIVKRRAAFAPLVSRLLYDKYCLTMKYGHDHEATAHEAYVTKQCEEYHSTVILTRTGLHIECLVRNKITFIQCSYLSLTSIRTIGWELHQMN